MRMGKEGERGSSWERQFASSLQAWGGERDSLGGKQGSDPLTGSLDEWLERMEPSQNIPNAIEGLKLFRIAYRASALQYMQKLQHDWEDMLQKIESPIEEAMLYALGIVGEDVNDLVVYRIDGQEIGMRHRAASDTLYIEPQAQLGEYRVDFLLTQHIYGPDFEKQVKVPPELKHKLPGVETVPGEKKVEERMIVECDGFDYHERTKEQASRDRERDRALQSFGYQVFRYTGSDIWADVFRCADEAVTTLSKSAWDSL